MPNYWLGIMAVAFAAAMALWITVVFMAGRNKPHRQQPESGPHREVMGGAFDAREGGRQVMPDPGAPLAPEPGRTASPGTGQQRSSLASNPRASFDSPCDYDGRGAGTGRCPGFVSGGRRWSGT